MSAARAAPAAVGPRHLRGLWGLHQGRRATEQTGPGEEQLLTAPRAAQATLRPAWGIDQAGDPRSASQRETHPHLPPRPETHSGSTTGSSSPEATGASGTRAVSTSDMSTPAALQRSGRRKAFPSPGPCRRALSQPACTRPSGARLRSGPQGLLAIPQIAMSQ